MKYRQKCLLVAPAYSSSSTNNGSYNIAWMPNLTLALLAALTPEKLEIEIIDENIQRISKNEVPDIVGITCNVGNADRAYKLADEYRKSGSFVVMGGHHVSAIVEEALSHCDTVVIGHAEELWPRCVEDFLKGKTKKIYGPCKKTTIDSLPIPRYDLLPNIGYALPFYPVETSRGCPNRCSFCKVNKNSYRNYLKRNLMEVIRDIDECGKESIFFTDDNMIGGNHKQNKELFDAIGSTDINWMGECDIRLAKDQSLLCTAAESGCVAMYVGIESVNQASLDSVNKGFNRVEEFPELIDRFRSEGIAFIASVIFGFDEDEPDIFEKTVEFLQENKVPIATFFILTPAPGSVIWEKMVKEKRILHNDWSKYNDAEVVFKPKKMTADELTEGLWRSYERYYSGDFVQQCVEGLHTPSSQVVNIFREIYSKALIKGTHPLSM